MALSLKDRVRESSSTTGTGTITLAGAYVGFQTFASVISNGDTVYYTIHNTAPGYEAEWEVGLGTFTASGTTLSRDTILSSSNSGSAVNFSAGTKEVFIAQPAEKAVFEDGSNNVTVGGKLTVGTGPTADLDVATKAYVDNATAAALHYHDPVRVESPSALTVTYNNGTAGVGATLTNAGTQAALVIDGITLNVADRVLIYTQTAAAQNGVYTVTDVGSGSTNWVLTRATDADSYSPSDPDSLGQGDAFYVKEGDTGAGESYVLTTQGTITFGTTAITFSQFAAAPQPGNGTLTMNVSGTGLSGSQTFTANQTSNATFTVTSNATSSNTNSTIVARDASGNFSAGTVTASLTGNVTGNLTGNVTGNADTATTASQVTLTNTNLSASYFIPFASSSATGNYALGVDNGFYYNPSANQVSATSFYAAYLYATGFVQLTGDTDAVIWGASSDARMFYDGTNNTMELELEVAAASFIITDNGTTKFTFTKATGDLTATSFTGALTGNVTGNVTGNLTGNVTGNADTATSATTAGSVTNSITFNNGGAGGVSGTTYNGGTAPTISYNTIGAPSVSGTNATGTWGISVSGNAATATALQTARTIGGVSFDGSANINLPGVNTTGNQNTSGNAASATTVNATVTGTTSADLVTGEMAGSDYFRVRIGGTASDAGFVELATADNGNEPIYVRQYSLSGADPWGTLTRSATLLDASGNTSFPGTVTATFSGNLTGNVTGNTSGSSGSCTGNAATATTLQTARTINGTSFDGSANITVTANTTNTLSIGSYLTGSNFNGSAATTWAVDATSANTASKVVARDASGNFSAGTITASLSGNATTSSSTTGNAATATTLQTARTINGTSFNGSANITVEPYVEDDESTNATRLLTFVDNTTAGYKRLNEDSSLTYNPSTNTLTAGTFSGALSGNASTATTSSSCSGNAASATVLQTARTINGVSFNGSANITITANANNVNTQLASLGVGTAASGTAGEIRATNNITAYYSDDRLKTKLGTIENALDKIDSLAGFYYEANQTAQDLGYDVVREVGVSAQSVQAVMPEVVAPAPIDEKYLTVRYERLVPLLIEGIKELRAEIKALKGE